MMTYRGPHYISQMRVYETSFKCSKVSNTGGTILTGYNGKSRVNNVLDVCDFTLDRDGWERSLKLSLVSVSVSSKKAVTQRRMGSGTLLQNKLLNGKKKKLRGEDPEEW